MVLVPTLARADGLCGTPDMSPALNYKALLYATPTHLPSVRPFTRPHVIISALSMHLPPVLWAWIRAPATHFLGARILTTLPLSIPPAAFSALPQHLPSPFSVIILSSQYLFQWGPIWIRDVHCTGAKLIVSRGSDNAFSGKWRQKHCQAARHVGSDGVLHICNVFVAYSNTKEKLTEKERANTEIILAP